MNLMNEGVLPPNELDDRDERREESEAQMADKHETIADIIAWLRRPREGENAYLTLWRDEIADRLEAAYKRERGDCAKLREALVSVQKKIHYLIGTLNVPNSLVANRMEINGIINAALAAPPRNCDRHSGDYKMLHTEWSEWTASPSGRNPNNTMKMTFSEWLLAPATEEEGGAK